MQREFRNLSCSLRLDRKRRLVAKSLELRHVVGLEGQRLGDVCIAVEQSHWLFGDHYGEQRQGLRRNALLIPRRDVISNAFAFHILDVDVRTPADRGVEHVSRWRKRYGETGTNDLIHILPEAEAGLE